MMNMMLVEALCDAAYPFHLDTAAPSWPEKRNPCGPSCTSCTSLYASASSSSSSASSRQSTGGRGGDEWKMLLYVAQLIRLPPTALMIGPLDGNLWVGQGRLSPSCCLAIYRHSSATICGRDRRHRFPLWEQERQVEDRPGGRFEHSAAFGDDDRGGGGRQANKTRSHNAPWLRNLAPAHCCVWTFTTLLCVCAAIHDIVVWGNSQHLIALWLRDCDPWLAVQQASITLQHRD